MVDTSPHRATIALIQELCNTLAAQGFDFFEHFYGQLLGVVGYHVGLDFIGTSPHEIAE